MGEVNQLVEDGVLCCDCGAYIDKSKGMFCQQCPDCERSEVSRAHENASRVVNKLLCDRIRRQMKADCREKTIITKKTKKKRRLEY